MDLCENSLLQDKFKNIFCEMSFFTDHNREAGLIWENLIFFQNQTKTNYTNPLLSLVRANCVENFIVRF